MSLGGFPLWTMFPFPALILAMALVPALAPRAWERRDVQALAVGVSALPVLGFLAATSRFHDLADATASFLSFVVTLGALYVTAGGVRVAGDLEGAPSTNVAIMLLGALLANVIGTTGASMLLIRPFLRANQDRENRAHLVPFFILVVANAGGLLTPLGDPPLLVGFFGGVPFFWTLRLLPAWLLYVGSIVSIFALVDRRAHAREAPPVRAHARPAGSLALEGRRNAVLMLAIAPVALLPFGVREVVMVAIAVVSLAATPRGLRANNEFSFGPVVEITLIFGGLFAALVPIQAALTASAASLPVQKGWHIFWASGLLSAVLDSAPTYKAFAALARGLSTGPGLVAGMAPCKLAGLSIGTVVLGATTYIGNAPNLMIKSMAEGARFRMPSFARFALFAFAVMLPAHLTTSFVLAWLER
jgi:Na+/H+ antiporter NhaD/arsenite permease-like protein